MTNQQGAPEALRLAEQYDYGDPAAHSNTWKVAVCTELRRQHARIAELEAQLEAVGAGGVSDPLVGCAPEVMVGGLQVYRCKIKSRKQIDREIPRELQGWWADVAAGQKLLLRQAAQSDLDRCTLGGKRSRNPADYMCETQTNGSLVSKVALEYMNPEENVFAAPPTTTAGSGKGE